MGNILTIVIIALLSSLFNKDKKVKQSKKRPEKPVQPAPRQNLQDLLREISSDINEVFGNKSFENKKTDFQEIQVPEHKEAGMYNKEEGIESLKIARPPREKAILENVIVKDEIRDEIGDLDLSFDKKSLIQGIIMSELLGRPKALRR